VARFEDWFPDQASNIRACSGLTTTAKNDFFDAIDSVDHASRSECEALARGLFHARKFMGDAVTLGPTEILGRLHEWAALEELVSRAFLIKDALDSYRDSVRIGDMGALQEMLDSLAALPLPPVVWCFRGSSDGSPFPGVPADALPCRLGLRKLDKGDYVPMEITPPVGLVARKATGFDAGLNKWWCAGGITCPRTPCIGETGFPEVIAPGKGTGHGSHGVGLTFADTQAPPSW
jgi:hypothetical protein